MRYFVRNAMGFCDFNALWLCQRKPKNGRYGGQPKIRGFEIVV
jgi:hypothetical protein